ncbi:SCO family protein [Sedimenticola selenatireducens]|uniref:SCO family protein n=1 Tax=Sedimenticola selenatireducens TaxID=191960 RepID=UPI0004B94206|nr:SCO family protein [Sedimenticola selenatireducens]
MVSQAFNERKSPGPEILGFLWPAPKPLAPFELVSTKDETFSIDSLKGHWTFMFFGYTSCPDVCPTALTKLTGVVKNLRSKGADDDVQVVFVSVDPVRDTIARMQQYVGYFDKSFVGATAALEQLDVLTRQLGILHERTAPDDSGSYLVDHTASVMLIDPSARLVGVFSAPLEVESITSRFQSMRAFLEKQI